MSIDHNDNRSQIPSETFTTSEVNTKTRSTMITSDHKYGLLVSSPRNIKRPKTHKRVTTKKKKKVESS